MGDTSEHGNEQGEGPEEPLEPLLGGGDLRRVTRLRHERTRPADPRSIGFQDEPTDEHRASAGEALRELGAAVSTAGAGTVLRVCLTHVPYAPPLPFKLYGFHLLELDENAAIVDPLLNRREILYALIVNHPVDLQREIALRFLLDLVLRQEPVAEVARQERDIGALPAMIASADAVSEETGFDALRYGWDYAAQIVRNRAADAGFRLEVRYREAPFPTRTDVVRRMPALRALYNANAQVREAVDRMVGQLRATDFQLRGGFETLRREIQRQSRLMGLGLYINQATRDSYVCGNGYLAYGMLGGLPSLRTLEPTAVEIVTAQRFRLIQEDGADEVTERVAHVPCVKQPASPYGLSLLEPLLFALERQRMTESVRAFVSSIEGRPGVPLKARRDASTMLRVVNDMHESATRRIAELLEYPLQRLPPAQPGLYFRGQERVRE